MKTAEILKQKNSKINYQSVNEMLYCNRSENQILLSIEARAFDEYEQIVWLGRPLERVTNLDEFFFIQEEALEINAEVRKSLRFDSKSMFIAAGKYRAKLSEDNKRIEILLNLSEKR